MRRLLAVAALAVSAAAIWSAVAKRRVGAFSMARSMAATGSAGASGRRERSGVGRPDSTARATASGEDPV